MKTPLQTDVLIVGAGLAGTMLALELRERNPERSMMLLGNPEHAATALAQGGIAAVLPGTDDAMGRHMEDTWIAGDKVGSQRVIASIIQDAPRLIERLEHWSVQFDRSKDGYHRAREGGHSRARVLHHQDASGDHVLSSLRQKLDDLLTYPYEVLQLVTTSSGKVIGVQAWDYEGQQEITIHARATVLATGGLGQLYRYTSNPEGAWGLGLATAMAIGTATRDLPFIQFHPTAFYEPDVPKLALITEALRGAGAMLRNHRGEPFMAGVHPQADLAPRDIVSRAMHNVMMYEEKPYLYLDATSIAEAEWNSHFPTVLDICRKRGIDPTSKWIPVVPAAHYSCGGVAALCNGFTQKVGLYAIGEVACTGFHGANRLASNSLLEAGVMALNLSAHLANGLSDFGKWAQPESIHNTSRQPFPDLQKVVKEIFQSHLGVVKDTISMDIGLKRLTRLRDDWLIEGDHSVTQRKGFLLLNLALSIFRESIAQSGNYGVFYNADIANPSESQKNEDHHRTLPHQDGGAHPPHNPRRSHSTSGKSTL